MAIATIATIPLDIVLVPWCQARFGNGAIGGSLAYTITELMMVVVGMRLLPAGALDKTNIWLSIRVLIAGLVMLAVVWTIRDLFIVIPIAVGGVVYVGLVILFRVVPEEDWVLLRSVAQKLLYRFRKHQSEPASL
jgi:predicted membrane channel-forming protein YqfA (hemolysin III family)